MSNFKEITFDYFPYFYRKWSNAEIISNRNNSIILRDSSSYIWNIGNSVGNGVGTAVYSPVRVLGDRLWQKCSVSGYGQYAGIDMSSYVWVWGSGNLGDNTNTSRYSPVSVVGDKKFRDILVVSSIFYGIDESSFLWGWGSNSSGQLGDGTMTNRSSPVSVLGDRKFIKIVGYGSAQLGALDESSFLWSCGSNGNGQLGDNSTIPKSSLVSVVGGIQWLDVKFSGSCNIGLDISSKIWTWGSNNNGQLGDNTALNRSVPVSVLNQSVRFINVDTSGTIVAAIDESSNFWQWGNNGIVNSSNIRLIPYSRKIQPQTLMLGNQTVFAIDESSTIVSFGYNGAYDFGSGTNVNSSNPVTISTTKKFKSFFTSVAGYQSMGLTEDDELWTWGSNAYNSDGVNLKSVPSMLLERCKNILPA